MSYVYYIQYSVHITEKDTTKHDCIYAGYLLTLISTGWLTSLLSAWAG